jgi:hypothetical protein
MKSSRVVNGNRVRLIWCACTLLVLASASAKGHPHDDPEIVVLRGTLTKVDVLNRTIELDTLDPRTKAARNVLLFLDKKAKLRSGRARLAIDALKPGQRVSCTVEIKHDEGQAERMIAFEIQLNRRT